MFLKIAKVIKLQKRVRSKNLNSLKIKLFSIKTLREEYYVQKVGNFILNMSFQSKLKSALSKCVSQYFSSAKILEGFVAV